MNNKRYVLTKDRGNQTELWELETGQCLQKFSEPFSEVKEKLNKFDQVHTKENPLPPTWLTVDLRLGVSAVNINLWFQSVTLTLEDDKWMKGIVNTTTTELPALMAENPNDKNIIKQDRFMNLGLNLVQRVFHKPQQYIRENEETKIKKALGNNYQDSLNAIQHYKATEAKKLEAFEECSINEETNDIENYFWYITEGRQERPIWVNNIDKREKPVDPEALLQVLPIQFVKNLAPPRKGANVEFSDGDRLSVIMITANASEIPQLKSK